jgi:hypothetical protein
MTQEEKSILLRDLCGRLPYNVKVKHAHFHKNGEDADIVLNTYNAHKLLNGMSIYAIRPYLRPMASITEDEKNELKRIYDAEQVDNIGIYFSEGCTLEEYCSLITFAMCGFVADWLNAHHFDYNGLIAKNLALVAPEGMYEIKQ